MHLSMNKNRKKTPPIGFPLEKILALNKDACKAKKICFLEM